MCYAKQNQINATTPTSTITNNDKIRQKTIKIFNIKKLLTYYTPIQFLRLSDRIKNKR